MQSPSESSPGLSPARLVRWIYRRVPAVYSLRRYNAQTLRADLIAGLTVATVAVPQAMAYAIVAGLPPVYGLYTAIVMTAVGAIFDSSRQLINGPTNAISIALLSAITVLPADQRLPAAILLSFLVGAIQLGITFARLGDLTRYISHSVIVGFTLGAGTLLVLDQLKNLLGLASRGGPHDVFLVRFWSTLTHGGPVHGPTAVLGVTAMVMMLALRIVKRRAGLTLLPDLLVTVVVLAAVTAALGLEQRGVTVVGTIPTQLPAFALPIFDTPHLQVLTTNALAIATLGLLEAISMAKAIAARTRQRLDIQQQCLSEGLANMTGSFFQCFPGSGSLTRSTINHQAGGLTQWTGVISALAVAAIMLVFGPYARYIPRSVMAGILIVSAWRMVDWAALHYAMRVSRFDRAIIAATAFSAVAISVEFCVLIGVFMSFLLTVPRAGRMLLTEFVVAPDGVIVERGPGDAACDKVLIFALEGEMFFGATTALERHLQAIERRIVPETRVLILRVKRVRNPDAVGLEMLADYLKIFEERGAHVILVGVRSDLHGPLVRCGIAGRMTTRRIFLEQPVRQTSTQKGLQYAYTLFGERCDTCPRQGTAEEFRYNI